MTCPDLPDLPEPNWNSFGMSDKDGSPVVCGGSSTKDTTLCQVYKDGSWAVAPFTLLGQHRWGASFKLHDGRYFIFGDFSG